MYVRESGSGFGIMRKGAMRPDRVIRYRDRAVQAAKALAKVWGVEFFDDELELEEEDHADTIEALAELNVRELRTQLNKGKCDGFLKELLKAENNRPGGARITAEAALVARIEAQELIKTDRREKVEDDD